MRNTIIYGILILLTLGLTQLTNFVFNVDDLWASSLSEHLTPDQVNAFINNKNEWEWLGMLIIPVFIFIKVHLITICLSIGSFLFDRKAKYKDILNIVLKADFLFLGVIVIKILWFSIIQTNYTFEDIQAFYPLSLSNLFKPDEIESWLLYPLQLVNLFEVVYWFLLAFGISKIIEGKFWKSFEMVIASYGTGLLIWIAFVVFMNLNAA